MKKKMRYLIPLGSFLMIFLLFHLVFMIGVISSESMEPTLRTGSLFVASRLFCDIEVQDIIVFRHEGKLLVKRVEATGGDMISLNDKSLCVPHGKLIVLGDNRESSYDSRFWEDPFVDERDVVAIVIGK